MRGFTLVELAITILIIGLIIGMGIPAIGRMSQSQQLVANTENIAGQLRMLRQRAISSGSGQTLHFTENFLDSDYHIHNGGYMPAKWSLSHGITYYWGSGTASSFTMNPDGTSNISALVILQDNQGVRDTVSVQLSGLVLTK